MHIGVIGSGNIGGTLSRKFAAAGHEVTLGSRDPESVETATGIRVASTGEAMRDADVIVLAVPGGAVRDIAAANKEVLDGKLVVDATNNMRSSDGYPNGRRAIEAAGATVRYSRAFSSLGWENFENPRFGGEVGDLLFSSADEDRSVVEELINAVGLRPIHLGDHMEDTLDGMLPVWFTLSKLRGRHLAFKVLDDSRSAP